MATINWVSSDDLLITAKQAKKEELSRKCNLAIIGGFPSSALGTAHTYPSDEEAQRNFNSEINKFLIDSTYTTSQFKTLDAGYLAHTKDQLFQVFSDGHNFKLSQLVRLNGKKADCDTAQTQPELDAITW